MCRGLKERGGEDGKAAGSALIVSLCGAQRPDEALDVYKSMLNYTLPAATAARRLGSPPLRLEPISTTDSSALPLQLEPLPSGTKDSAHDFAATNYARASIPASESLTPAAAPTKSATDSGASMEDLPQPCSQAAAEMLVTDLLAEDHIKRSEAGRLAASSGTSSQTMGATLSHGAQMPDATQHHSTLAPAEQSVDSASQSVDSAADASATDSSGDHAPKPAESACRPLYDRDQQGATQKAPKAFSPNADSFKGGGEAWLPPEPDADSLQSTASDDTSQPLHAGARQQQPQLAGHPRQSLPLHGEAFHESAHLQSPPVRKMDSSSFEYGVSPATTPPGARESNVRRAAGENSDRQMRSSGEVSSSPGSSTQKQGGSEPYADAKDTIGTGFLIPQPAAIAALVTALACRGRLEEALQIFRLLQQDSRGLASTTLGLGRTMWQSLIEVACRRWRIATAVEVRIHQ